MKVSKQLLALDFPNAVKARHAMGCPANWVSQPTWTGDTPDPSCLI